MTSEELLKEIKEMRENNRSIRERNNQLLSHLEGYINKKKSEDYEKGLNDAWTVMARILFNDTCENNITEDDLLDMFPECVCDWNEIIHEYTPIQVLDIVAKYDQDQAKKKEEAKKELVMGDVVEVYRVEDNVLVDTGIYLGKTGHDYILLFDDCEYIQYMNIDSFILLKVGKHVDLKCITSYCKER